MIPKVAELGEQKKEADAMARGEFPDLPSGSDKAKGEHICVREQRVKIESQVDKDYADYGLSTAIVKCTR